MSLLSLLSTHLSKTFLLGKWACMPLLLILSLLCVCLVGVDGGYLCVCIMYSVYVKEEENTHSYAFL